MSLSMIPDDAPFVFGAYVAQLEDARGDVTDQPEHQQSGSPSDPEAEDVHRLAS